MKVAIEGMALINKAPWTSQDAVCRTATLTMDSERLSVTCGGNDYVIDAPPKAGLFDSMNLLVIGFREVRVMLWLWRRLAVIFAEDFDCTLLIGREEEGEIASFWRTLPQEVMMGNDHVSIKGCSACGEDHNALPLKQLRKPLLVNGEYYDWWVTCPTHDEPVFVKPV